jgi:Kef-type K+ transport system membrane component KefB
MKRVMALVLVLSLVLIARRVGGDGGGRFATMALGFVLIVAALVGEVLEHVKLPRLTGYLLVGLAFGPSVLDLVTPGMAGQLRMVNGLAVALIAFSAGMELDIRRLRTTWRSLAVHGAWLIGVLYAGIFAVTLLATPWLPFTATLPWSTRIAVAMMTASVLSVFSPTVVMAVIAETQARGPLTERVLQLVVLADLVMVVLFTGCMTVARLLSGAHVELPSLLFDVSWELIGSVLAGLGVGIGIFLYRVWVDQRTGLFLGAVCLFFAEVGGRNGLSPLLCCLAAGCIVRNAAPEAAHTVEEMLERVRMPVLVVFFAAAGASLHLGELKMVAPMAVAIALVRAFLIVAGNRVAAGRVGIRAEVARYIPCGLISQAGVALGLAVIVGCEFGAWGATLETLFVAVISMHEMVGPIILRWALARNGEVPQAVEPLPHEAVAS